MVDKSYFSERGLKCYCSVFVDKLNFLEEPFDMGGLCRFAKPDVAGDPSSTRSISAVPDQNAEKLAKELTASTSIQSCTCSGQASEHQRLFLVAWAMEWVVDQWSALKVRWSGSPRQWNRVVPCRGSSWRSLFRSITTMSAISLPLEKKDRAKNCKGFIIAALSAKACRRQRRHFCNFSTPSVQAEPFDQPYLCRPHREWASAHRNRHGSGFQNSRSCARREPCR